MVSFHHMTQVCVQHYVDKLKEIKTVQSIVSYFPPVVSIKALTKDKDAKEVRADS